MIYTSFISYSISKFASLVLRDYFYLSDIYADNILELRSPKLINYTEIKSFNSSSGLPNINNVVNDTISPKQNKFEKKYKSSYSQDIVEIKKNKNKLSKKNRKTSNDALPGEIFIESQDELFNQDSLGLSLVKTNKLSKIKKKDKNKSGYFGNNQQVTNPLNTKNFVDQTDFVNNNNIVIDLPLSVQELSNKLNIPEAEIITYLFLQKGMSITINEVIDISTAKEVALSYNFNILKKEVTYQPNLVNNTYISDTSYVSRRAPIITVLGHVDHGKTTLLDSILKTNFVQKEYGGITQSISGYEIDYNYNSNVYKLVFLDTPGHKAFKSMRIRGAKVTDIALLVVAADDGLKPQTIEAIKYIIEMNLSYIVVINKIDKQEKNITRIKEDLANYKVISEDWGGDVIFIEISALTGQNIDFLLSKICLLSDTQDLFSNPNQLACGFILESYLNRQQGSVANILIQNGTLNLGDVIVSSNIYGKVKSIMDTDGNKLHSSSASSIVQILGFSVIPQAGKFFEVVQSEKEAKKYCLNHIDNDNYSLKLLNNRVNISTNSNVKQFKLIIKADTQGSLEAITNLFAQIPQTKVQIYVISANFNIISNTDIELALATGSSIITFNLNINAQMINLIKKNNIVCHNFNVIYDLLDYVKSCMLNLIEPEYDRNFIGRAIVQTVFNMNKGSVAGCIVNEGKLKKMCYIHVHRNNLLVYEGLLISLKRLKDDVEEVLSINECGLMCDYSFWEKLDVINAYELVQKSKSL
uniref:Translation initiation factor IF-2, chloroplastic n=1 Tax=Dasyclonium flaccidum TaxID=2007274 RepID=A0A1Z1MLK1_9FLOR|nr:translation initiation factor 2 [Dasyclonium flaccidum]ARW66631.1 translation initiation factor 2 [Dasyclonium flaccidum]